MEQTISFEKFANLFRKTKLALFSVESLSTLYDYYTRIIYAGGKNKLDTIGKADIVNEICDKWTEYDSVEDLLIDHSYYMSLDEIKKAGAVLKTTTQKIIAMNFC